jgi:NAD(P)H-dependent FMN reductase
MKMGKINILAISGSLRPGSSASAVLRFVGDLIPGDAEFHIYPGIGKIPAFDDSNQVPVEAADFIRRIAAADAVFFCIPEYAFGVPGALKNAVDWTVSSTAFSDKPVALITAASGGEKAHAAFALTLTALGTKIKEETKLLIPFIRTQLNEKGEIRNPDTLASIKKLIHSLLQTIVTENLINP